MVIIYDCKAWCQGLVNYPVGCLDVWLAGWLAAWLPGCLAAWLPGCLAAWLPGCLAAWLPGPVGWQASAQPLCPSAGGVLLLWFHPSSVAASPLDLPPVCGCLGVSSGREEREERNEGTAIKKQASSRKVLQ